MYADLAALNYGADFAPTECSSFAGWGSMTTDSSTIAGRNFDWTEIPGVFEKQFVIVTLPPQEAFCWVLSPSCGQEP